MKIKNKSGVAVMAAACASAVACAAADPDFDGTGGEESGPAAERRVGLDFDKIKQGLGPPTFVTPPGNVRILSKKQYLRTVRHLLGTPAAEAARPAAWDGPTGEKFVAAASVRQSIGTIGAVVAIADAADVAAGAAVANRTDTSQPLANIDACTTESGDDANDRVDCYRRVATALGRVAFKLPPLQEQVDALVAIAQEAEGAPEGAETEFESGLHQLLSAILQAPSVLYSFEVGDVTQATPRPLLPHELATRMSLTLLGRGPSLALLETAAGGGLSTAAQIKAEAQAMLAEPEAQEAYWDMVEEWFLLDLFDRQERPSFPQFTDQLRSDMLEEARRFAVDHVFGSSPLPFPQLLSSQRRFITPLLATTVYTQQPINLVTDPDGWGQIDFNDYHDQNRSGFITLPAFLTVLSSDAHTKIVARGKFLWERVLCGEIINLPAAGVGAVPSPPDPPDGVTTFRILLEEHANNAACASCHQFMDPGGFALEHFDQIGAYRETDPGGGGGPINATTTVIHPRTGFSRDILDGLDFGKLMADPTFPDSDQFVDNTAACQLTQLHEAMLGEPMQGSGGDLDATTELANLQAAVPGYPQYMLTDFYAEFVASTFFTTVGEPR